MQAYWKRAFAHRPRLTWESVRDYAFIFSGALLQALSLRLFLIVVLNLRRTQALTNVITG